MITKVALSNFQCHEALEIEIEDRIVCLTGRTDVGKSAVLRAVRWLVTNKPSGKAFIRKGSEEAGVVLVVDGGVVERRRGEDNLYVVNGKEYRSFKAETPSPVAETLQVGNVSFQGQHDSPFLLSLPPSQVAKELNALIDLAQIDETLTAVNRLVRQTQAEVEVTRQRLKEARVQQKKLLWTVQADSRWKAVERLQERHVSIHARIDAVTKLLQEARQAQSYLQNASEAIRDAEKVVRVRERAERLREKANQVRKALADVRRAQQTHEEARQACSTAERELRKRKVCPECGQEIRIRSSSRAATST